MDTPESLNLWERADMLRAGDRTASDLARSHRIDAWIARGGEAAAGTAGRDS